MDIREFAKLDSTEEDILFFEKAARAYIEQVTGKTSIQSNEIYELAVKQLATHWYDNRSIVEKSGEVAAVPFTIETLIGHISLCGEYAER